MEKLVDISRTLILKFAICLKKHDKINKTFLKFSVWEKRNLPQIIELKCCQPLQLKFPFHQWSYFWRLSSTTKHILTKKNFWTGNSIKFLIFSASYDISPHLNYHTLGDKGREDNQKIGNLGSRHLWMVPKTLKVKPSLQTPHPELLWWII